MELSFTHFRILFDAIDGAEVRELTYRSRSHGLGDADFDWPEIPRDEARTALQDLLRAGYVELFRDDTVALQLEESIAGASTDAAWETFDPDSPDYYAVGITDAGEKVCDQILPRYWPEGVVEGQ